MPDGSTVLRARYWIVPSGLLQQQQVLVAVRVFGSSATEPAPVIAEPVGRAETQVGELELAVGRRERVGLQRVRAVRVALDHLGERVALELRAEVHARRPVQVVEPVAVLQVLQRVLEHVVERAAEQAAEEVRDLAETADPQVDVVEAGVAAVGVGPGAGAEHEVGGVGRDGGVRRGERVDDRPRGVALAPRSGRRRRAVDPVRTAVADRRVLPYAAT